MPEPTTRRHPPPEPPPTEDRSVAELVFDVSESTSTLVREEIELAKAEVSEKVGKILRGSAVGVAAGVFAFLALILVMEGIAWLLNEEVFDGNAWPGFFVEAAVFLLIAAARRLLRLPRGQGRRAAGARAGDRRGEADQGDARKEEASNERRSPSRCALRPPARPAARRRRSAATSTPSASELGSSVEALRGRVTELTDWRRQVREHSTQLIVGAAVVGFAIGGLMRMLRRRALAAGLLEDRLVETLPTPSRPGPTWAPRTAPISEMKAGSQPKISRQSSTRASAVSWSWMCWTTQASAPDSWRWRA